MGPALAAGPPCSSLMPAKSGPSLPKSGFSENILRTNHLLDTFAAWVFYPGMLFHAAELWWKGRKNRNRPHEGLDLCYYRDREGSIQSLHREISIPVIYDGEIVKTERDFLGESVYVRHPLYPKSDKQLYSVYGHIRPHLMAKGKKLHGGDILGSIADASQINTHIPSHLHITLALVSGMPSPEQLVWSEMQNNAAYTLIDPLPIIDSEFIIME